MFKNDFSAIGLPKKKMKRKIEFDMIEILYLFPLKFMFSTCSFKIFIIIINIIPPFLDNDQFRMKSMV